MRIYIPGSNFNPADGDAHPGFSLAPDDMDVIPGSSVDPHDGMGLMVPVLIHKMGPRLLGAPPIFEGALFHLELVLVSLVHLWGQFFATVIFPLRQVFWGLSTCPWDNSWLSESFHSSSQALVLTRLTPPLPSSAAH